MTRLSPQHAARVADRARALADVTRVRIIDVLARTELPVGSIASALGVEPSIVSKHLQVLYRDGLVVRRRMASSVIYSIANARLHEWCRYLAGAQLQSTSK